ncbi:MAG: serine hydrolase [Gemmatimonadetes bacterium]|nr:serine hydrolase [Gemmatimonadota bacterium]MBP7549682.1 serine hydrolase [Gemmatimonadaceae bacterium]
MTRSRVVRPLVAIGLAVALGGASLPAQGSPPMPARPAHLPADTAQLRRTLDALVGGHRGIVGYAIHDLETGARLGHRADEPFPTASLIKVPILVTLFTLAEQGMIDLDDPLTVLRIDKVGGAGQLQFLHDGAQITVRDAAWLMTTISDNTATNLLLDRIVIRRVWARMDSLGLPRTRVHHKSFLRAIASVAPDSSAKYGLGVSTPNEMARLFELLARGRAVSARADSTMLDILAHNEDGHLLQRYVSDLTAPHKTGADDGIRTECALWTLPDRVVACVMTRENADLRWNIDNEAQVLMGRMGEAIVRAFRRDGAR